MISLHLCPHSFCRFSPLFSRHFHSSLLLKNYITESELKSLFEIDKTPPPHSVIRNLTKERSHSSIGKQHESSHSKKEKLKLPSAEWQRLLASKDPQMTSLPLKDASFKHTGSKRKTQVFSMLAPHDLREKQKLEQRRKLRNEKLIEMSENKEKAMKQRHRDKRYLEELAPEPDLSGKIEWDTSKIREIFPHLTTEDAKTIFEKIKKYKFLDSTHPNLVKYIIETIVAVFNQRNDIGQLLPVADSKSENEQENLTLSSKITHTLVTYDQIAKILLANPSVLQIKNFDAVVVMRRLKILRKSLRNLPNIKSVFLQCPQLFDIDEKALRNKITSLSKLFPSLSISYLIDKTPELMLHCPKTHFVPRLELILDQTGLSAIHIEQLIGRKPDLLLLRFNRFLRLRFIKLQVERLMKEYPSASSALLRARAAVKLLTMKEDEFRLYYPIETHPIDTSTQEFSREWLELNPIQVEINHEAIVDSARNSASCGSHAKALDSASDTAGRSAPNIARNDESDGHSIETPGSETHNQSISENLIENEAILSQTATSAELQSGDATSSKLRQQHMIDERDFTDVDEILQVAGRSSQSSHQANSSENSNDSKRRKSVESLPPKIQRKLMLKRQNEESEAIFRNEKYHELDTQSSPQLRLPSKKKNWSQRRPGSEQFYRHKIRVQGQIVS